MTEIPKCEWPTDCKKLARYKVQFYVDETGRFSRPMNFCATHFKDYQVEDDKCCDRWVRKGTSEWQPRLHKVEAGMVDNGQ